MKQHCLILAILLSIAESICLAAPPPFKPGDRDVPPQVGRLGYYLGTYLTIAGTNDGNGKFSKDTLQVDRIKGFQLEKPIPMLIFNVDPPVGRRCILTGYETGYWMGASGSMEEALGPTQWPFQFVFTFVVTFVEQPDDLRIKPTDFKTKLKPKQDATTKAAPGRAR
jgi:hypothetical protein